MLIVAPAGISESPVGRVSIVTVLISALVTEAVVKKIIELSEKINIAVRDWKDI